MKELTLNRMPEADITGFVAYGRAAVEEEGELPVPFVMVPDDIWELHFGNAKQINVQLSR